jgi:hypothetical protein
VSESVSPFCTEEDDFTTTMFEAIVRRGFIERAAKNLALQDVEGSTNLHPETYFMCQGEEDVYISLGEWKGMRGGGHSSCAKRVRNEERTYHWHDWRCLRDLADLFVLLHDFLYSGLHPVSYGVRNVV